MIADLTAREVAELSGFSKRTVEKAIEEKVLQPVAAPGRRAGRVLPRYAVAYVAVTGRLRTRLDLASKRRLAATLANLPSPNLEGVRFEIEPALEIDLGRLADEALARTDSYRAARDTHIVVDDEILGGTPVIRGTRMTVYSVLGRIENGDTAEEILSENPHISPAAIEVAVIYARSHPLVGRPGGRPWTEGR